MEDPLVGLGDRFARDEDKRSWRDRGACGQIDPDTWFPERGEPGKSKFARKTCIEDCEVRAECFQYAINDPTIQFGIWGGFSANELRKMRRERGLDGARLPEDIEPEDESVYYE